jgi:hypothetical protein
MVQLLQRENRSLRDLGSHNHLGLSLRDCPLRPMPTPRSTSSAASIASAVSTPNATPGHGPGPGSSTDSFRDKLHNETLQHLIDQNAFLEKEISKLKRTIAANQQELLTSSRRQAELVQALVDAGVPVPYAGGPPRQESSRAPGGSVSQPVTPVKRFNFGRRRANSNRFRHGFPSDPALSALPPSDNVPPPTDRAGGPSNAVAGPSRSRTKPTTHANQTTARDDERLLDVSARRAEKTGLIGRRRLRFIRHHP